jgi:hypothetical protein
VQGVNRDGGRRHDFAGKITLSGAPFYRPWGYLRAQLYVHRYPVWNLAKCSKAQHTKLLRLALLGKTLFSAFKESSLNCNGGELGRLVICNYN